MATKAKTKKAAPAKVAHPAPQDGEFVLREPLAKDEIKLPREGSKRAIIMGAMIKGATIEQICKLSGWQESAARSFMGYDVAKCGLGVKRVTKNGLTTYHLLTPKGIKL